MMNEEIIFDIVEPAAIAAPDFNQGPAIYLNDIGQCPIPDGSTSGIGFTVMEAIIKCI